MAFGLTMPAPAASDADAIRELARKTWERPDAPVSMNPIVIVRDYASAGWIQGAQGGRALLRKRHGAWEVIVCSGDHLRSSETSRAAGVPGETADALVKNLAEAERALPTELVAKFSLFDGIVRMDGASPSHSHKH
jgi:hypothetical protein